MAVGQFVRAVARGEEEDRHHGGEVDAGGGLLQELEQARGRAGGVERVPLAGEDDGGVEEEEDAAEGDDAPDGGGRRGDVGARRQAVEQTLEPTGRVGLRLGVHSRGLVDVIKDFMQCVFHLRLTHEKNDT